MAMHGKIALTLLLATACVVDVRPALAQEGNGDEKPWFRCEDNEANQASDEERAKVFKEAESGLADTASDQERQKTIENVFQVSGRHEAAPLVKVLKQRMPAKAFRSIISMAAHKDAPKSYRRKEFVQPLILALPQVDESIRATIGEILTHDALKKATVAETKSLLEKQDTNQRIAATYAFRLRPGGTDGVVELLEGTVELLTSEDENLRKHAKRALIEVTAIDKNGITSWRAWLRQHPSSEDRAKAIADALAARAQALQAENEALQTELQREVIERMRARESNDVSALVQHLNGKLPLVRGEAIEFLTKLLPTLKDDDAKGVVSALVKRFDANLGESEENQLKAARALQKAPDGTNQVLLLGLEEPLIRNGLPVAVMEEVLKTLKDPQALPLLARLFEGRAKKAIPFASREHLAMIERLQFVTVGELSAVQEEEVAKILVTLNSRLSAAAGTNDAAFEQEFRWLATTLDVLNRFGRNTLPLFDGLTRVARSHPSLEAKSVSMLYQAVARFPNKAAKVAKANAVAVEALTEVAQKLGPSFEGEAPHIAAKQIETIELANIFGAIASELPLPASLAKHWRATLLATLKAHEVKGMPEVSAALAKHFVPSNAGEKGKVQSFIELLGESPEADALLLSSLQALAKVEERLALVSAVHAKLKAKDGLAFAKAMLKGFEDDAWKQGIAKLQAASELKLFEEGFAKDAIDEAAEKALIAMATKVNAKAFAAAATASLKAAADPSALRDTRVRVLLALLDKVEGLKLDGVELAGDKDAMLKALGQVEALLGKQGE
ncbi:MAG: hypothetical protein KDB07_00475 [Planctomycetes bacterium]|nr:hypothetical protein [Planctomycetota bacterium]